MTREGTYLLLGSALVAAGGLMFAGVTGYARLAPATRRWMTRSLLVAYALLLLVRPDAWLPSTLLVLAVGIAVGYAIGRSLSTTGALMAFLVVVAVSAALVVALAVGIAAGGIPFLPYALIAVVPYMRLRRLRH